MVYLGTNIARIWQKVKTGFVVKINPVNHRLSPTSLFVQYSKITFALDLYYFFLKELGSIIA